MDKDADAYRTISEVAQALDIPPHVLRFWETKFPQIRPLKRGGGRRYYRRGDTDLLCTVRRLLYEEGYTIRGVQRLLKSKGCGGAPERLSEATPVASDLLEEAAACVGAVAPEFEGIGRKPVQTVLIELAAEIASCRTMLDAALRTSGSLPDASPVR